MAWMHRWHLMTKNLLEESGHWRWGFGGSASCSPCCHLLPSSPQSRLPVLTTRARRSHSASSENEQWQPRARRGSQLPGQDSTPVFKNGPESGRPRRDIPHPLIFDLSFQFPTKSNKNAIAHLTNRSPHGSLRTVLSYPPSLPQGALLIHCPNPCLSYKIIIYISTWPISTQQSSYISWWRSSSSVYNVIIILVTIIFIRVRCNDHHDGHHHHSCT